jgi:hypothetical protein
MMRRNERGCRAAEMWRWTAAGAAHSGAPDAAGDDQSEADWRRGATESRGASVARVYGAIRCVVRDAGALVCALQRCCSAASCPLMTTAGQHKFLCAAHKQPQDCCAIDYAAHTVDGAAALLCSKVFPSRTDMGAQQHQYLASLARRLYRIFSHAFYRHPDLFRAFEDDTHLFARFVALVRAHNLMTQDMLEVPDSAFAPPPAPQPAPPPAPAVSPVAASAAVAAAAAAAATAIATVSPAGGGRGLVLANPSDSVVALPRQPSS